ncbi:MAG: HAD family hydrolase [Deltaproteobacteria bacterium]
MLAGINSILFDLDGTLYVCDPLAREIKLLAGRYIASLTGIETGAGMQLIIETQKRLSLLGHREATLTEACLELGGDLKQLHRFFADALRPELFLKSDPHLVKLLRRLEHQYELYIYTNNNRALTEKILNCLALSGLFRQIFTIEDFWQPKPDSGVLESIFARIDRKPVECLFIGDRYDVDLRLPAQMGSSIFLSKSVQELLALLETLHVGGV